MSVWVDLDQPDAGRGAHPHRRLPLPRAGGRRRAQRSCSHPKVEAYDDYLYLILHGIDFQRARALLRDADVDFFLGAQLSRHRPRRASRASIGKVGERLRAQRSRPRRRARRAAAPHRRLDGRPLSAGGRRSSRSGSTSSRKRCSSSRNTQLARQILDFKKRRRVAAPVVMPQRDVVGRLARREFPTSSTRCRYRFRDVYDHLVRLADEAMFFQDRDHRHPRRAPVERSRTS